MASRSQIALLLNLYMQRQATPLQEQELQQELANPQNETIVKEILVELQQQQQATNINTADWQPILDRILQQGAVLSFPTKDRKLFTWKRIAVAASIIGLLFVGYWLLRPSTALSPATNDPSTIAQDVPAPDKNRAQIKLADGTIVYLDSATSGQLATQNSVTVIKNEQGEIVYNGTATAVEYNTMFNPRGSKVQPLTLSDGTKVWLNSESSIKYPTAFTGSERKVEITGEAYFEVAHQLIDADLPSPSGKGRRKPFIVTANGTTTEVLGTHFNINAYDDEQETKITLLEGSVRVSRTGLPPASAGGEQVIIKPGEQAFVARTKDEAISINNTPDLEQVMAWRNGLFKFGGSDLETVMKQLARWYDVELVYEGQKPTANFRGTIARKENISEVLKMLELTKAVKFKVDGKKIIISK